MKLQWGTYFLSEFCSQCSHFLAGLLGKEGPLGERHQGVRRRYEFLDSTGPDRFRDSMNYAADHAYAPEHPAPTCKQKHPHLPHPLEELLTCDGDGWILGHSSFSGDTTSMGMQRSASDVPALCNVSLRVPPLKRAATMFSDDMRTMVSPRSEQKVCPYGQTPWHDILAYQQISQRQLTGQYKYLGNQKYAELGSNTLDA